MKKQQKSIQLDRTCNVIKSDRMGVTCEIKTVIQREIENTLNGFFSLNEDVKLQITATDYGFDILINASAKNVKQFKMIG